MFVALLVPAVALLGPSAAVLRLVPALVGMLSVGLLYGWLRGWAGGRVALCAAGTLAVMRWHALFSRLIFRTILLPGWMMGVVWLVISYRRRPTWARAAGLGFMIGGGFYTYLAWYFLLPLVAVLGAWLAIRDVRRGAGPGRAALALACAVLTASPMAVHYLHHPEHILRRPGAVSPFAQGASGALSEIGENGWEALGMFHWRGDHVVKHNLPHEPALDPLQGILMLYGLVLAARQVRRGRALGYILAGWLVLGMLTTIVVSTDSPNFNRTLCVTPVVATLIGLGLADMGRRAGRRFGEPFGVGLVCLLIGVSGAMTAHSIFMGWGRDARVWHAFNGDQAQVAQVARQAPGGTAIFVPQFIADQYAFRFQTLACPGRIHGYEGKGFLRPLPPGAGRDQAQRWVLWTALQGPIPRLLRSLGSGAIVREFVAPEGNTWGVLFALGGYAQNQRPDRDLGLQSPYIRG